MPLYKYLELLVCFSYAVVFGNPVVYSIILHLLPEFYLIEYKVISVREVVVEYIPVGRTGINMYSMTINI